MKRRLSALAVITALTALLSGCYPAGQAPAPIGESESEQTGDSNPVLPFPDNIILEMDLPKNTPSEVPSVILTLKKWDKEEIKNLFFDGKVITYENEIDEKHMPGEKFNCWDTEDEMVAMRPGRIHYDNKAVLGGEFRYGTVYHYGTNDCTVIDDSYASDEELSAFSHADAKKLAQEMIDKLGITNLGEPRIISVHANLANKILEQFKGWKENAGETFEYTPWTENEEIYVLRYPQVFENTELAMNNINYTTSPSRIGTVTEMPGVIAVVNKDKILSFQATGIFSEKYELGEKFSVKYNSNQALEKFREYLSNCVWDSTIKYYSCKLVYIPYTGTDDNLTVSFKPAWEFAGFEKRDKSDAEYYSELDLTLHGAQFYEYFYADTGHRYVPESN